MTVTMDQRRTTLRRVLAAVIVAATAAGLTVWGVGQAGAAASPVWVEKISDRVGSENFKNVLVRCPGDTRLFSAGFNITDGLGRVAVNTLKPSSDLREVLVEANETDGGIASAWQLRGEVICGTPPPGGLRLVSASVGSSLQKSKSATPRCADTEKTYGGGFVFPNGYGKVLMSALSFETVLKSVSVEAHQDATAPQPVEAWGLTAYAICGAPASSDMKGLTGSITIDSTSPKSADLKCPTNTRLLAVGARIGGPAAHMVIEDIRVKDGTSLTTSLTKAFENNSRTDNWWLAAYGVCSS